MKKEMFTDDDFPGRRLKRLYLQVCKQAFGAAYFSGTWLIFDVQGFNDAILDKHGIPLGTNAKSNRRAIHLQANRLSEIAIAVRKKLNFTFHAARFFPRAHNEDIVDRGAGDEIDALRLEGGRIMQKSR